MPKNINFKILQRFLRKDDLDFLAREYKKNTEGNTPNRANNLDLPITQRELDILNEYLFQTDKTLKEIGADHSVAGLSVEAMVCARACRIAAKYLRQKGEKVE